jgi:Family of unknown function (DUF6636)
MRLSAVVPVAAVLLLGTAACTGEDDGAAPATSSATATAAPASSSTAPRSSPVPPAPQVRVVGTDEPYAFQSPSGNIFCAIAAGIATCEITDSTFERPAKPSDCDLDYGEMISVTGDARAEFPCHGDTAYVAGAPVLAYGERVGNDSVTCTSATTGLTCATSGGSHGFELSRAAYRVY